MKLAAEFGHESNAEERKDTYRMRECFWCLKKYLPTRRLQGGGHKQVFCSQYCVNMCWREENRHHARAYIRLKMREYRRTKGKDYGRKKIENDIGGGFQLSLDSRKGTNVCDGNVERMG